MTAPTAAPFTFASKAPKGRYASIYRPPGSPDLPASTPALTRLSTGSRKRARADSTQKERTPDLTGHRTRNLDQCPTPGEDSGEDTYDGNLVNERYCLAGGFDTPSVRAAAATGDPDQVYEDLGRRSRAVTRANDDYCRTMPLSGPLARERNGNARLSRTEQDQQSGTTWAMFAFGLVSKAFNFGSGMIKGFYSGGGQGYDLAGQRDIREDIHENRLETGVSTPIPGSWMDESTLSYVQPHEADVQELTGRPSTKRRQTDKDEWVMVSPAEGYETSRRRISISSSRTGLTVRLPPASRAANRRNLTPTMARRQSSYIYASGSPGHDRRASIAPTRSPGSAPNRSSGRGYFSPEAERHVKRQAKQDMKINHISQQLEDLIRQGQEALGTKVSVESTDTDAGYGGDW